MEQGKFRLECIAHEDEASYRLSHLKLENMEVSALVRGPLQPQGNLSSLPLAIREAYDTGVPLIRPS